MDQALKRAEIQGVLLDSYVAGHYNGIFDQYRVNRVFQARKNYGFVLGRRLSTSSMYQRFKDYGERNKDLVTALVENQTTTPHVSYEIIFMCSFFLLNPTSFISVDELQLKFILYSFIFKCMYFFLNSFNK